VRSTGKLNKKSFLGIKHSEEDGEGRKKKRGEVLQVDDSNELLAQHNELPAFLHCT
jgi:hypothetical protein